MAPYAPRGNASIMVSFWLYQLMRRNGIGMEHVPHDVPQHLYSLPQHELRIVAISVPPPSQITEGGDTSSGM